MLHMFSKEPLSVVIYTNTPLYYEKQKEIKTSKGDLKKVVGIRHKKHKVFIDFSDKSSLVFFDVPFSLFYK